MKARQLLGEHLFPAAGGLKVTWQWTDAIASAEIPDNRRYRYDPDRRTPEEDDFLFSLRNDSNQRRWTELDDDSTSWNLDFLHPFEVTDSIDFGLKYGFNRVDKFRDSSIRRFAFICRGAPCRDIDLLRNPSVEDIIYDETIQPGFWQLEEVTNATDSYTGAQEIDAFHVGMDWNFGETLRLAFGIRDEQSNLAATTFNLFDPDRIPVITEQNTDDTFMFTSATLFLGDHQIRAGYAETTNRPDFKEISPSQYRDPLLDRIVQGNPDLEPAFITHYDIRWDYYFNPGEFISLGVFYKEFDRPIEFIILASGGTFLTTFDNAETAENFGAEFELYKTFDFLDDWWGWGEIWGNFYVNTNYAWIDSEITLDEDDESIQTSTQRPLQGQSPYVWNFQIGYDDLDREINAALLYNVFGERIVEVGAFGAPDTYEQPRPSLDFVYSQGFGNWKLKAKAKNLLDPEIELTQGPEIARLTQPIGREYSVAVEYTFR
jgi:outer membrane receptor protein involved in Fe transport